MKIILIRHTSVDVARGICYGFSDVPLSPSFEQEAEEVKKKLEVLGKFDRVFSSPLMRATRLAEYCGFLDYKTDDRLREMNMGEWEMKRYEEIVDPNLQVWYEDYINTPTTNGESFKDLIARVGNFFDDIKSFNYNQIAVFTHSGVITASKILLGKSDISAALNDMPKYGDVIEM